MTLLAKRAADPRGALHAFFCAPDPAPLAGSGYILHSDHSIPDQVEYDTYKFFLERGLEMGTYKQ